MPDPDVEGIKASKIARGRAQYAAAHAPGDAARRARSALDQAALNAGTQIN